MNWLSFIKRLSLVICLFGIAPQHTTSHAAETLIAMAAAPLVKEFLGEFRKDARTALSYITAKKTRCKACNVGAVCKSARRASICKGMCTDVIQIGGQEIRIRFGEGWTLAGCVKKAVEAGLQDRYGNKIERDDKQAAPYSDLTQNNMVKRKRTKNGQWIEDNSIAVYNLRDLNYLLILLAKKEAAQLIIDTQAVDMRAPTAQPSRMSQHRSSQQQNMSRIGVKKMVERVKSFFRHQQIQEDELEQLGSELEASLSQLKISKEQLIEQAQATVDSISQAIEYHRMNGRFGYQ